MKIWYKNNRDMFKGSTDLMVATSADDDWLKGWTRRSKSLTKPDGDLKPNDISGLALPVIFFVCPVHILSSRKKCQRQISKVLISMPRS